jgi:hypothetical protein
VAPLLRVDREAYLRLVVRLAVDFLFRVAAAFLAPAERLADFLFRVAAAFLAAVDRLVDFRAVERLLGDFLFRVAAAFLAAVDRLADFLFRVAAAFLAAVDLLVDEVFLLRVAAICHLLSKVRTPCASGVVALAR